MLPARVVMRLEGYWAPDFYREQLIETLKVLGCDVSVCYASSQGVHFAREWQIKSLAIGSSRFVLVVDDDVILDCQAIYRMCRAVSDVTSVADSEVLKDIKINPTKVAYYQGTKWDCANTRGYRDFSLTKVDPFNASNYNMPVSRAHRKTDPPPNVVAKCYWLDTGFVLFDRKVIAENSLSFIQTWEVANCGGEDALFALQCESLKVDRIWVVEAEAIHLEKPSGSRFPEATYRKEVVLRTAKMLKYPTDRLNEFLSWVPIRNNSDI